MDSNQRKYEIFISSTFIDLIGNSRKTNPHNSQKRAHTICNGAFSSGSRKLELIKECISNSDIFVIVLGARYGSRTGPRKKSYILMKELELAKQFNKPIIPFLLDDEEYKEARKNIPPGEEERKFDDELEQIERESQKKLKGIWKKLSIF